jgi:Rrf2 family protein
MRMNEGVEWALHSCLNLAWVGTDQPLTAAKLAAYHDLPAAYLNKQLQALARAGIVSSTPGPRGGFQLARAPEKITLLDVVVAIEGAEEAFRCQEIRQRGAGADLPKREFRSQCEIAKAMRTGEVAWRRALSDQTVGDIMANVERIAPDVAERRRDWFATV